MKNIFVTGGGGYIGSFMVRRLLDDGYNVTVIDNLERGYKEIIDSRARLQVGNILDKAFLLRVFKENPCDAVVHFAGYISVGESMQHPDEYFRNNTFGTFCLIEQMRISNVKNIIFSSTAGIYGNPIKIPISEEHPKNPESPYGESKLLAENGLAWYQKTFGVNYVALRYFNAAGASLDGTMGENHLEETHIIPNVINAILSGSQFTLYGNDYETKDGTCVRDYIHVLDLIEAHLLALEKLRKDLGGFYYNVGTGLGYSNKQIVQMVEQISGKPCKVRFDKRREGDPATLIADNSKIKIELGFKPKYSDLETIIETAWKWHMKG